MIGKSSGRKPAFGHVSTQAGTSLLLVLPRQYRIRNENAPRQLTPSCDEASLTVLGKRAVSLVGGMALSVLIQKPKDELCHILFMLFRKHCPISVGMQQEEEEDQLCLEEKKREKLELVCVYKVEHFNLKKLHWGKKRVQMKQGSSTLTVHIREVFPCEINREPFFLIWLNARDIGPIVKIQIKEADSDTILC
ncbi:hypothetical protein F2Q68_00013201 [Brassica cretica]|uniref:Uncharacterized protein n=1 Tax=Brassica cretica TaxID=69181 RepID=A0A8S9HA87_BRACR|nr:hypothetical protein F2Q68_00013201 [Brassica cretica]